MMKLCSVSKDQTFINFLQKHPPTQGESRKYICGNLGGGQNFFDQQEKF